VNHSVPVPAPLPSHSQNNRVKSLAASSFGVAAVVVIPSPASTLSFCDSRLLLFGPSLPARLAVLCRLII
jgi:hypothetical protein